MSHSELELLAPAGQMDVLRRVVAAGADAVYLGGQRFNMRALKDGFHFSEAQIGEAAEFVHDQGRKLYITVNNLYNGKDILEIKDYLLFLHSLGVDAFIVQDLGMIELCRQFGIKTPLHASVQMGIANLDAAAVLEAQGFQRAILSKNVSLPEIREIAAGSGLGIEYFVHGDQCISHAGQCYLSSFMAGASGNQGRCRKPCRWEFEVDSSERPTQGSGYYLAHKDLCLYPFLSELVTAGVTSFKIEGRMRGADYLAHLVSVYRRALDRLQDEGSSYRQDDQEYQLLVENRIRDFTCGNLWGTMNRSGVGVDGSREPFFISIAEPLEIIEELPAMAAQAAASYKEIELSVRLGSLESVYAAADLEIDNYILGSELVPQETDIQDRSPWRRAIDRLSGTPGKVFVETPRIVSQRHLEAQHSFYDWAEQQPVEGFVVNDLGSMDYLHRLGKRIWGGYGLNTFNPLAATFLSRWGMERIIGSLEMKSTDWQYMLSANAPMEVVVQGQLPGMITDYCVIRAVHEDEAGECPGYCRLEQYNLKDRCDQRYPISVDRFCRNYIHYPYEICLLPYLLDLSAWGVDSIRIEGQHYDRRTLTRVVGIYRQALQQIAGGNWKMEDSWAEIRDLFPGGLSSAAFGRH